MPIFTELWLVLIVTAVVSFVLRQLKQPMVVAYIVAGIIAGPMVLNITSGNDSFELFAQVGVTILLFIVGLHLNPSAVKDIGSVSLVAGISQVLFTSIIGFGIGILLGLDRIAALYVSIALTFSSTIIILKLLSDKGHVHTLYGRISVGMLLVQDLLATLIMLVVSTTGGSGTLSWQVAGGVLLIKALIIFAAMSVIMRWIIPRLLIAAGKSQELLFLFAITWGLSIAGLFQSLGFSVEIGALIAGVVLSSSPLVEDMSAKLRPLRDFFIIIFFVLLGSHIMLDQVVQVLPQVIVLSLFVLIGNPVIVFVVMNLLGYHKRTGFMTGLTVAQISEFSLILAALAFDLGHISRQTVTLITLVGLITITGSTYFILYGEILYQKLLRLLTLLELRKNSSDRESAAGSYQTLIIGYEHIGKALLQVLSKLDAKPLVIDFNPAVTAMLTEQSVPSLYGDIGTQEFLNELPVKSPKLIISSVHDLSANEVLIRHFRQKSRNCVIIIFSQNPEIAERLVAAGATKVINPLEFSSLHLSRYIQRVGLQKKYLERFR